SPFAETTNADPDWSRRSSREGNALSDYGAVRVEIRALLEGMRNGEELVVGEELADHGRADRLRLAIRGRLRVRPAATTSPPRPPPPAGGTRKAYGNTTAG